MFNLLPKDLKEMIIKGYKSRRLVVVFVFVLLAELSFLIFLFPTWLVSMYKEREIVKQAEAVNILLGNSKTNPSDSVRTLNSKLLTINNNLEYPKFQPIIDTIISKKTSSVTLNQFTFVTIASSSANIDIGGVSSTREALVSFVKRLEDTKLFKKVDLPISNLAKDKNIDFVINLSM